MGSKRRRPSASQTIGGVLFGFEQQVLRTTPPPQELVHHARPDDPVPAGDGTMVSIELPVDRPRDVEDEPNTEPTSEDVPGEADPPSRDKPGALPASDGEPG